MGAILILVVGAGPATIRVPADRPTIREAIEAAKEGDTILVAPGTYRENLRVAKSITLSSQGTEPRDVEATVIDGGKKTVITVAKGADVKIVGLTIRNGDDGVCVDGGRVEVLQCRLLQNDEGVSFEGGRGVVRGTLIEGSGDDGIDCDGATDALIEDNVIRDCGDDGVEVRLHEYRGPRLSIVIRGNVLSGHGEDGVQLIDYPDVSDRLIRVERNLILRADKAGLGCMGDGDTVENYRGSALKEPVYVIGNTFVENRTGLTGADNMVVVNNLFVGSRKTGLKRLRADSVAAHNLFWKNGTDLEDAECRAALRADPLLDGGFKPRDRSPALDAGVALFEHKGVRVLELPAGAFAGKAPDLGAFERR